MKIQTKLSTLLVAASLPATALAVGPSVANAGTVAVTARSVAVDTVARPGAPGKPKVVKLRSSDRRVTASDSTFRPGVTEFRVVKTAHHGSSLAIVETDNLDLAFQKLGKAISGAPGSADAMKAVDRIITAYGGGANGAVWQVELSKGTYYILDNKTNKMTTFTVRGERRSATMVQPDSEVWTTKQNQFETSGDLTGEWISFTNHSREIHFLEASRVARDTTAKDVRQSFKSQQEPTFGRPGGFFFEVQSPGIETVHRQSVEAGKYLLMCWMPSEQQDGTPHAMMGMWHLVMGS